MASNFDLHLAIGQLPDSDRQNESTQEKYEIRSMVGSERESFAWSWFSNGQGYGYGKCALCVNTGFF